MSHFILYDAWQELTVGDRSVNRGNKDVWV